MIEVPSIPQYVFELSLSLMVFYGMYHYLLRRETFHQFNRSYLLITAIASVLFPLIDMSALSTGSSDMNMASVLPLIKFSSEVQSGVQAEVIVPSFYMITVGDIFKGVFYIGLFLMALKFMFTFFKLLEKVRKAQKRPHGNQNVTFYTLASFFSFLYWNDDENNSEDPTLSSISSDHISRLKPWHSLEVLVMEILVVLNWYNPLIYLYRNSLYRTHEYIADSTIASQQGSNMAYAQMLHSHQQPKMNSDNSNINNNDRAHKVTQSSGGKYSFLKPFMIVPITMMLMGLFSFNITERMPVEVQSGLSNIDKSLERAGSHVVMQLTHSKRNYEWAFKWGDHIFGMSGKDEEGNPQMEINQDLSLYDLLETVKGKPSYKKKNVDVSFGFNIKITSESDSVSNLLVGVGDFDGLDKRIEQEIVKHKTPFTITIANIKSKDGKYEGGFTFKIYQYLGRSTSRDTMTDVPEYSMKWGDINLESRDFVIRSSDYNFNSYGAWRSIYNVNDFKMSKTDFVNKVSKKLSILADDEEIAFSPDAKIGLYFRRKEFVRSRGPWDPVTREYTQIKNPSMSKSVSTIYHGRNLSSVTEDYDYNEVLEKGDEFFNDLLKSVVDGDVISVSVEDSTAALTFFYASITIEEEESSYDPPYEVELPPTSDTYTNFQVYYNPEEDQTYVKVDTTASANQNIVKAYRNSTSYKLMHVPDFKTKTRVNDTRTLPAGILKIDADMDLKVGVQKLEQLNEHYTNTDHLIRMDWGRMISMPGVGNFSFKEFRRSSLSNILLSAGDNFMDIARLDIVIINKDKETTRIRTDNIKSQLCRQAFRELNSASSIYFDNIIINDNDTYKYYPYQFVFNVE